MNITKHIKTKIDSLEDEDREKRMTNIYEKCKLAIGYDENRKRIQGVINSFGGIIKDDNLESTLHLRIIQILEFVM